MRSRIRSRACGMKLERHAERGRGALPGVVVGRGADAAAREHDVAAGERIAQVGGDARRVVADVARPAQRQAARGQQLDHLGQVLVVAFAGEDLVADDDEAEVHGGRARGGWQERRAAARRRRTAAARAAAASPALELAPQRLQRGQRVVREPERGEREHQRVEPDRDDDQQRREHAASARRAPRPATARRRGSRRRRPCPAAASGARAGWPRRSSAEACSASTSKAITR